MRIGFSTFPFRPLKGSCDRIVIPTQGVTIIPKAIRSKAHYRALPFEMWKKMKETQSYTNIAFLFHAIQSSYLNLLCLCMFQLRKLISSFVPNIVKELKYANDLFSFLIRNSRVYFSLLVVHDEKEIFFRTVFTCVLWNMFKIFRTCLVESITATKEIQNAVAATLLFVRCWRTGDWN